MNLLKATIIGLAAFAASSCAVLPAAGSVLGIAAIGSGKADHLPGVFKEPSQAEVDPELPADKIKADLAKYYEIHKLVVYGDDPSYEIRRNELGIIVDKLSRREVWIAYKDLKDGKYYYNSFKYIREFDGTGYGPARPNFAVPTEITEQLAKE